MLLMSHLLIHSEDVPASARAALASAQQAPAGQRCESLIQAAVILHREVGLDCSDARELVGLADHRCGPATQRV